MCILVTYLSASFVFLDPFAVLSRRRHRLFLKRGLSRIVCGATCKEVMEQRNFLPNVRAEGVMFLNSTLCFYPILYPPNFFNYTLRNSFLPVINKCESSVAKTQTTLGDNRRDRKRSEVVFHTPRLLQKYRRWMKETGGMGRTSITGETEMETLGFLREIIFWSIVGSQVEVSSALK